MSQQVYYVFCNECGGDTAMHTISSRCLFCGAKKESLQVILESTAAPDPALLTKELERVRSQWVQSSTARRKGWFRKKKRII